MSTPPRWPSDHVDPSPLGQSLKFEISGKIIQNRFFKAATSESLSSWAVDDVEARGIPSESLINVYKRWGQGGFGVIISGNIMIDYEQLEAPGNSIIPDTAPFEGERFEAFRALATHGKVGGAQMIGQLSHPGRQVSISIQPQPVSASDVQIDGTVLGMQYGKPHPASHSEIAHIVNQFAHAAHFLEEAGWDGVQLHAGHGYLLAQFLTVATNSRTDEYGGSLRNRARIILEIAEAIRKRTKPSFVLGIKLNSVEFQKDGFSPEEARKLCEILDQNDFDFAELSGGTYERLAFRHMSERTRKREAFFLEFAETIAPALKTAKTFLTGGFKSAGAMVDALSIVDGIGLARAVCHEPSLCNDILQGKVLSAILTKLDQDNIGLQQLAAGSQIRLIGAGRDPLDFSQDATLDVFMQRMAAWIKRRAEDSSMQEYGFIDLS